MSIEASAAVTLEGYNPMLPEVRANPYPYYALMRREDPIHRIIPGVPFFAITRYDDVRYVVQHPEQFSSTALRILSQGGGVSLSPNSGALAGHRLVSAPMMIAVDPPDHGPLRTLVNRGFTPRRIAALEPRLRLIAADCIDRKVADGRMDLVRELAIPFPVTVIAELLGVEPERHEQFKYWSDAVVLGLSGVSSRFTREEVRKAADEFADYIEHIAADRRRSPREDLISVITDPSAGLELDEVLAFVVLLLVAGNETTTNLIGNAMRALLEHPPAMAELRRDHSLIPAMIEEALRYDSPVQGIPRKVVEDVELAGTKLPKEAFLMVMFASANRDESHFPDPDLFDIHRSRNGHIAFGYGLHFCLGAALARLEARVAFETIFDQLDDIELASDEVPMLESSLLRGPRELQIGFRPGR